MLHPCLTLIFILNHFGILLQHTQSLHRLFLLFSQSFVGLHMLHAFTMERVKCLFKIYEIQLKCCLPLINLLSDVLCIHVNVVHVVQFYPRCNFHFSFVSNSLSHKLLHPHDRTNSNNFPFPGPKAWSCPSGCPGRW